MTCRLSLLIAVVSLTFGCESPWPDRQRAAQPAAQSVVVDEIRGQTNKVCEVHHIPLQAELRPISYGMPVVDPVFADAQHRLFPHWCESWNQGCIEGPWKYARVLTCYQCRSAYFIWKRTKEMNPE